MVGMRDFVAPTRLCAAALALSTFLACSEDDDGKVAGQPDTGSPGVPGSPEGGSPGPGNLDGGKRDLDAGSADAAAAAAVKRIPQITPLVRAAAPEGLGGVTPRSSLRRAGNLGVKLSALDSVDIKSRFFTEGPTSVYRLLGELDRYIDGINNASSANSNVPCLTQPPVEYAVEPFGRSLRFYAQCASGTAVDFVQFGEKDGVIYLYVLSPVQHAAVRLTPRSAANGADAGAALPADNVDAGGASDAYLVDAWLGLGYNNASSCGTTGHFDGCSYGVMELHTEPVKRELVLSVAGLGFGYCGAQLKSDGVRVFGRGSLDMGMSCLATSDLCVLASDVTTASVCSGEITTFGWPAIGRTLTMGTLQSFGASLYPGGADNQVTLDGTATDSLSLGPSAPAEGAGMLNIIIGMAR